MHRSTLLLSGAALSGALVLMGAAPAMAHDCYNASRSEQGSTSAAAHSDIWVSIPEFLSGGFGFDQATVDRVMAVVNADPRVPAGFAVHVSPGVAELATNAPLKVVTNNKGIDHSEDNGVI